MLIVEGITCCCVEYLVKGGKYFFEKWIFFMRIAFIDLLEPLFEDPFQDIYGSHSSINEKEEVEVVNHVVDVYASVHDG